jgi:hypothetical protein
LSPSSPLQPSAPDEKRTEGIPKVFELLRCCDEMVSKLDLFPPNKTMEDVSTANLKYLLDRAYPLSLLCQAVHEAV